MSTVINDSRPAVIKPNATFAVETELRGSTQACDFRDYNDAVFGLAALWDLDVDMVKTHWVANLFAAGKDELGKQVVIINLIKLISPSAVTCLLFIHFWERFFLVSVIKLLPAINCFP